MNAIRTAIFVAKAGCARFGRSVSVGTVSAALAVMLSIGCGMSHGGGLVVDADGDGYDAEIDCDDSNPRVYPGAPEYMYAIDCCDGTALIDYDCDGMAPICSCNPIPDADGDGYTIFDDCNDGDPNIYPGAPEEASATCCDGGDADQDCDGVPPLCPLECSIDLDGDGFTADEGDCDDTDASVHPGARDVCEDGVDANCDGTDICDPILNEAPDADGDGYDVRFDCNDDDPTIHPGAEEDVCPDGIDQDCDGEDGFFGLCNAAPDADGDGYSEFEDCDDSDPTVHPGADEDICPDGVDQNCDGFDGDPDVICNGMADVPDLSEEVA